MLRLHYVAGGHGSHVLGNRGRNRVIVVQRTGFGWTNVARRGCRGRPGKLLNCQKIATAATAEMTNLLSRSRTGRTQQNATERNRP